jgi:acetyl esterase/lipase
VWLTKHADKLGVNPKRIAIGGASAGGGLAAALALLARDRAEVAVAFQLLIYPMIDDCNVVQACDTIPDTLLWTRRNNLIGWRCYLGSEPGGPQLSAYAAPTRAMDLSGLPPAYIPVGSLDLFLRENVDYAMRLLAAGVPTELHVYPGGYHGFDAFGPDADVSKRFTEDRDRALRRALHGQ